MVDVVAHPDEVLPGDVNEREVCLEVIELAPDFCDLGGAFSLSLVSSLEIAALISPIAFLTPHAATPMESP